MIRLDENEISELAAATGVSVIDLQKLYVMGMLKDSAVIGCLVRYDYNRIKKMGKYTPAQIFFALTEKYKITRYAAQNMVYSKYKNKYYCEKCGIEISKSKYIRNDGLCDKCVALSIDLNNIQDDDKKTN